MRDGWEIKKVGDCFESIKNGVNIKQERGATGTPITRIETLSGGVFNRDRLGYANILSTEKYTSYILDDGDLLLSHINSKAYIGRTVVYNKLENEEIIHGMNLLRLKVIRKILSPYYAYYCFNSDLFRNQIASYRKDAVNQSSIPVTDLKKINIPVPPLAEQEHIVEELDLLSGIIEKQKQQLKEYDILAQSIFYTMFGDPITNEKGWEVKKLGEVAKVRGGYAFKSNLFCNEGTPVLRIGNINTGVLKTTQIVFYKEDESLNKYIVYPKDLVMSLTGTAGKDDYGNVCVLDDTYPQYYLNQRNAKIELSEVLRTDYLKYFLKDTQIKSCLTGVNRGVRQGNISNKDIEGLSIQIPPLPLQQSFAAKVEAIEQQKALIKQSLAETETLFNSRMDYYFN